MLLELLQPDTHLVKGVGVGDIVAEQGGMGTAIVQFANAAEALLTGGVPYLKADGDVGVVWNDEGLGEEVGADGRLLNFFKLVVYKAVEERGFADALGSKDDYFGCEEGR